ncbi:MAG: 30S ribosome-binding factor RbfA [Clostridia bacterium]|nr:30S ribosome-binding factor RbfA [Clostridia bacterium]
MKFRQDRINDSVARTVGEILRSVKDPRVSSGFVTVNHAEVTRDLKFAKIFYGVLAGDRAEVEQGLRSAVGYIRRELAARLDLRLTPELTFVYDGSAENGARIARILKEIEVSHGGPAENSGEDGKNV